MAAAQEFIVLWTRFFEGGGVRGVWRFLPGVLVWLWQTSADERWCRSAARSLPGPGGMRRRIVPLFVASLFICPSRRGSLIWRTEVRAFTFGSGVATETSQLCREAPSGCD